MITVKFYSLIRLLIKTDEIKLNIDEGKISDILELSQQIVSIRFIHKLLDENKSMITGTIILVNGHNIHHLEKLNTIAKDGDIISLFPPGGGG